MGIMDNEGHDPMRFGNVQPRPSLGAEIFERQYRQACQDHASAMAEIERLNSAFDDCAESANRWHAEAERLRAALGQIISFADSNGMQDWKMTKIARKALGEQSDDKR